jgi:putative mRNA 3-end processing factor
MIDFGSSIGTQDVLMSQATRALLIAELKGSLETRRNVIPLELSKSHGFGSFAVTLESSGHTLDSVQVVVEYEDGTRLGYSGDFAWPLERVPQMDALVIDSTNGVPEAIRNVPQTEVEDRFMELVVSLRKSGPITIKAHRGTSERAAALLSQAVKEPILVSRKSRSEFEVYKAFGHPIGETIELESPEGQELVRQNSYIFLTSLRGKSDQFPYQAPAGSTIILSTVRLNPNADMQEYVDDGHKTYQLPMSNHADFNGTIDYIKATGAKYVVTDNTEGRGGRGAELARQIKRLLSVDATPSTNQASWVWGT